MSLIFQQIQLKEAINKNITLNKIITKCRRKNTDIRFGTKRVKWPKIGPLSHSCVGTGKAVSDNNTHITLNCFLIKLYYWHNSTSFNCVICFSIEAVIVSLKRRPCCWQSAPTSSSPSSAPGSVPPMASSPEISYTGQT